MTFDYKPSDNGLILPLHSTVKGKFRWQVLDERGVPEIPRNASGFPVGPVEGVEQDNLITDYGLDTIGTQNPFNRNVTTTGLLRSFLAAGTGSAAPSPSDRTLQNEVAKARSEGSFTADPITDFHDVDNEKFVIDIPAVRVLTMPQDYNLTEIGFAALTNSDTVTIRELLRDSDGTPTTVTLLEGKTLRVDHVLRVELPAPPQGHTATVNLNYYDAGNNLVESTPVTIRWGFVATGGNYIHSINSNESRISSTWQPNERTRVFVGPTPTPWIDEVTAPAHSGEMLGSSPTRGFLVSSLETYVEGSFKRVKRHTLPAGDANADIHSFAFGVNNYSDRGNLWMVLENPASFRKTDTEELVFGFASTWARG